MRQDTHVAALRPRDSHVSPRQMLVSLSFLADASWQNRHPRLQTQMLNLPLSRKTQTYISFWTAPHIPYSSREESFFIAILRAAYYIVKTY